MKKVIVTGGAGFVGGPLSRRLTRMGHEVVVYDNFFNGKREHVEGLNVVEGDIRDYALFEKTAGRFVPDVVFHLAALHFIPYCNAHPVETIDVNTRGTASVLDVLKKTGTERVIAVSTAAVYRPSDTAHSENGALDPIDIYGVSKLNGEELMKLYQRQTGRTAVSVRLFNVYGPGETNPHVLPDILEQLPNGDVIELGNVEPKRDYIFVEDVVDALIGMMEKAAPGKYDCFNLAPGEEHSVTELVELIAEILGRKLTIKQHPDRVRKSERLHLLADTRHIREVIGWTPRHGLREGLEKTLASVGLLADRDRR